MPRERTTLEDFALKGNHLAKMTGVSVATHAIPDAFLLMHTGVGCKYKAAAQIGPHDWAKHPNRREAWTQVGEVQLIKGSAARIGPFARSWYERRRPSFMPVVSAYFIELTGEDCRDVVKVAEKTVPCDMAMITTAAPNGGYYDGYADVTMAIVKRIDWKTEDTNPGECAIVGYYFDRYEADHQGNLGQVRTLLKAAGLQLGPVLLSGTPYPRLLEAGKAEHLLVFPYMGKKARRIKRVTKRKPIQLDLPVSVAGTSAFVRAVAEATGNAGDRVERYVEGQEALARKQLALIADHTRNLRVAIFADSPLAAGLYALCQEIGIEAPIVGIRDDWLGGTTRFLETLERWGLQMRSDTELVPRPSLAWVRKNIGDAIMDGHIHGILGSAHETTLFRAPPHRPGEGRSIPRYFTIEVGFPTDNHHVTMPLPTMGYSGALMFAQRILDMHLKVA